MDRGHARVAFLDLITRMLRAVYYALLYRRRADAARLLLGRPKEFIYSLRERSGYIARSRGLAWREPYSFSAQLLLVATAFRSRIGNDEYVSDNEWFFARCKKKTGIPVNRLIAILYIPYSIEQYIHPKIPSVHTGHSVFRSYKFSRDARHPFRKHVSRGARKLFHYSSQKAFHYIWRLKKFYIDRNSEIKFF